MTKKPQLQDNSNSFYSSDDEVPSVNELSSQDDEEEEYESEASVLDSDHDYDDVTDDDEFEDQGSDSDSDDLYSDVEQESDVEVLDITYEDAPRAWKLKQTQEGTLRRKNPANLANDENNKEEDKEDNEARKLLMTDDLSSDDEDPDGLQNRIGRVPLHWYEEHDHIGYNVHGSKIAKGNKGDLIDAALNAADNQLKQKNVIYDALNDREVTLTERQLEIIRRIQNGAVAHPEHNANPDMIDYFSGVDREISGLSSNQYEKKSRFQPSKWEALQVRKLLHRLKRGNITMDFLTGKVKDMNDVQNKNRMNKDKPYMLWQGDEEDERSMRRGPEYIPPPKQAPPGHAESYNPREEYLPTEEELKEWTDKDPADRPYGLLIPKKFPNLRSLGAYEHSVRERFERCLDLYLCPRQLKKRLNIDPESLVPQLPKASDLRPFPTAQCIEYKVNDKDFNAMVRCISVSPNGQYLASGYSDGFVRLWEVSTARVLKCWDLNRIIDLSGDKDDDNKEDETVKSQKPVTSLQWNPNKDHHCLLAAIGTCAVIIATGTGSAEDAELTDALFSAATAPSSIKSPKAAKAVKWIPVSSSASGSNNKPISCSGMKAGPITFLRTNFEIANIRWHRKGDYFVSVSPNATSAAVLIHQLSKANSQQPFSKSKGEVQCACFHPNKPFLFVANKQQVRIYHLVEQKMAKRLVSGCRWIQSIDVHPSGDHVIVGSLDRRMVWFDLDLSSTPYKTLKYHEKALRSVKFHPRYPLMASASDDGNVHIFHSMVYSDLMRNPLVVPVKILRGHKIVNKIGVLSAEFHPTQPWIFSGGADGTVKLFHDM